MGRCFHTESGVLLVFLTAGISRAFSSWIPGCYSVWDLNELYESASETGAFQDIPSCFCDNATDNGVQVSCLFGSTISDLSNILDSVDSAGKQAVNIHLSHVDFGEEGIPAKFFHQHSAKPSTLIITACPGRDPVKIHPEAFEGMAENLTQLIVNDCKLKEVPKAIANLSSLVFLEIRYSLLSLKEGSFSGLGNLKQLNLSENYLHNIEVGSLKGLDSLEHLALGPKNYFNETVFSEINTIHSLKHLDLHSLQLQNIPEYSFSNLSNLLKLILTGNNLVNLTKNTFNGLDKLEELDLRVNLLENLESGLFMPLRNLNKLNLAGNYISEINQELFVGLENLTSIDLGWNEFYEIPNNTFSNLTTLQSLDLRHNLKLGKLQNAALHGLNSLVHINLSTTNISELSDILLRPLKQLEKLELTGTQISELKNGTFWHNSKLQQLFLNKNQLYTLPDGVFSSLEALVKIDLSENPWLCDDQLAPMIEWVFSGMYTAAETSEPFNLLNVNMTKCDRPYNLRGELLMDLDPLSLQPYDSETDTTVASWSTPGITVEMTTLHENSIPNAETADITTADTFHINNMLDSDSDTQEMYSKKPGNNEERKPKHSTNSSGASIGIAVVIIIAVIVTVVLVALIVLAMRKKKEDSKHSNPTDVDTREMTQKQPACKLAEADIIRDGRVTNVKVGGNEDTNQYSNQTCM